MTDRPLPTNTQYNKASHTRATSHPHITGPGWGLGNGHPRARRSSEQYNLWERETSQHLLLRQTFADPLTRIFHQRTGAPISASREIPTQYWSTLFVTRSPTKSLSGRPCCTQPTSAAVAAWATDTVSTTILCFSLPDSDEGCGVRLSLRSRHKYMQCSITKNCGKMDKWR